MTRFNNLAQTVIATLGAIVLTSTAVGAAVGPAGALEAAPAIYAAAPVTTSNV